MTTGAWLFCLAYFCAACLLPLLALWTDIFTSRFRLPKLQFRLRTLLIGFAFVQVLIGVSMLESDVGPPIFCFGVLCFFFWIMTTVFCDKPQYKRRPQRWEPEQVQNETTVQRVVVCRPVQRRIVTPTRKGE